MKYCVPCHFPQLKKYVIIFFCRPATPGFGGFNTPTATTTAAAVPSSTGLTFGSGTFGTPGSNLFSTPQQTPGFGTPGTGLAPAPTATSAPSGFSFGTSTPSLGAPTFGSLTTANATPFGLATPSFGLPKTTATVAPTLNFGGGTATSFNFGTPATTATPSSGLGFGITPAATTTQSTGISERKYFFILKIYTAYVLKNFFIIYLGFALGQPAATTSLTFGAPKTTGGFSFGTTTPGLSTATSTTPSLNFGLPSSTIATSTPGFSLGGTGTGIALNTSTVTTSVGLGGIDNLQTRTGLSGPGTSETKQVKDNALPEALLQSLNEFQ